MVSVRYSLIINFVQRIHIVGPTDDQSANNAYSILSPTQQNVTPFIEQSPQHIF